MFKVGTKSICSFLDRLSGFNRDGDGDEDGDGPAQNWTIELEGLLADFSELEQKTTKELNEKSKAVARLETEVAELKKREVLAKNKAIEEFKSSNGF